MITKILTLITCATMVAGTLVAQETVESRQEVEAILTPDPIPEEEPDGIEITAIEEASFDSENNMAIFIGDVQVKDVRFQLRADKLVAYLDPEKGGLKRAEATGNVIIVQVTGEIGADAKKNRSTGKAQKAIYDPEQGTVTLTGWPQVRQGINLHKASEASTRMVLNPSGKMKTYGQSKTIIQDKAAAQ